MSSQTARILARWTIGILLVVKAALVLTKTAGGSDGAYMTALPPLLLAFGLGVTGLILMAPELVPWISAPVWRFITGIIFPDEKYSAPPVNYALPRSYSQRFRDEEAIQEYLKIIRYHPQEQAAYVECIEVMLRIHDLHAARKLMAEGLRKLRTEESRNQLREVMRKADENGVLKDAAARE
jgi:hypothetical protein